MRRIGACLVALALVAACGGGGGDAAGGAAGDTTQPAPRNPVPQATPQGEAAPGTETPPDQPDSVRARQL